MTPTSTIRMAVLVWVGDDSEPIEVGTIEMPIAIRSLPNGSGLAIEVGQALDDLPRLFGRSVAR